MLLPHSLYMSLGQTMVRVKFVPSITKLHPSHRTGSLWLWHNCNHLTIFFQIQRTQTSHQIRTSVPVIFMLIDDKSLRILTKIKVWSSVRCYGLWPTNICFAFTKQITITITTIIITIFKNIGIFSDVGRSN